MSPLHAGPTLLGVYDPEPFESWNVLVTPPTGPRLLMFGVDPDTAWFATHCVRADHPRIVQLRRG